MTVEEYMARLSLTMIVKNEEKHLARCLQSVKPMVDEMIVVDTGSTDRTKQIAKEWGAKVFDFPWNDSFADARNFSLSQSTGDWNLVLDADEYFVQNLSHHIRQFIESKKAIGRIAIVSRYMHDGEIRYSRQLSARLLPKGVFYQGRIHEQVVSDLPHVKTEIEVYHEGYFQTDKTDRNLPLLLKELEEEPENPYLLYHVAINYKNKKDYRTADHYFSLAYSKMTHKEGFAPVLIVDYLYNILANGNVETGLRVIEEQKNFLSDYPDFHFVSGLLFLDITIKDVANHLDKIDWIEQAFLTCLRLGDTGRTDSVIGSGSYLAAFNLAVFYEVFGETERALRYYEMAARYQYQPAVNRLMLLREKT
jgi:glycosyltransferase involved in cell wall biosynthesis